MKNVLRERRLNDANLIDFASNDTLGLAKHPSVIAALTDGAKQFGVGSTASPVVCGHSQAHKTLEAHFCDVLGFESALTFSSGFAANLAVLTGLLNQGAFAWVDRDIHASMCDGLRLCKGKWKRYKFLSDCQSKSKAKQFSSFHSSYLITESVFSTSGRQADWENIEKFCHDNSTRLILDDAHGFGVIGKQGLGALSGLSDELKQKTVVIYPMGKALGCQGAVVCGPSQLIDQIMQNARSLIYSTALSPAMALAATAAFDLIVNQPSLNEKLLGNIAFFRAQARRLGLEILPSEAPIQSIVVGDADLTEAIRKKLRQVGFNVGSMRPPTVPDGKSLIRMVIHAFNTHEEIERVCNAFMNSKIPSVA